MKEQTKLNKETIEKVYNYIGWYSTQHKLPVLEDDIQAITNLSDEEISKALSFLLNHRKIQYLNGELFEGYILPNKLS